MTLYLGLQKERIVNNAIRYINDIFMGNSGGHDINHTMRVYSNALDIANYYKEADLYLISLGALLHDVDDHKLFDTDNNKNAREFLKKNNVDEITIEKVIQIINEVSFSENKDKKPSSLEGMIVQDADRLDAMGAIGIARTFAYGGEHNRPMESSIQHFYDKLLLLKDSMNTEAAKRIALGRHQILLDFLNELSHEIKR